MSSGSSAYHTRQPESLGIKRDVSLESLSNPENAKKNAEAFQPLWYTPPKGTKGAKTSPKLADGKQWERCKNMIMEYDSTVMDNWKTDIQNQLVVSALLSAITSAFVIETQAMAQEDPATTSAVVLMQILKQLNQSIELPETTLSIETVTSADLRVVNTLYYFSLALSLAVSIAGLLCLQWLQEYQKDAPHLMREKFFDFRHVRYLGFEGWGARTIISSLPLLLILALIAFIGGLLTFLATSTDWVVASPVFVVLLLTSALIGFTTFAPAVMSVLKCMPWNYEPKLVPPFRSAQSWLALKAFLAFAKLIPATVKTRVNFLLKSNNWVQHDTFWTEWTQSQWDGSLQALLDLFSDSEDDAMQIYQCFMDADPAKILHAYKDNFYFLGVDEKSSPEEIRFKFLAFVHATHAKRLESIPDTWQDALVEGYVGAVSNSTQDPAHAAVLRQVVTMSKRLDLLLKLLHAMLANFSAYSRTFGSPAVLWTTLGRVLTHPEMPLDLVPSILDDTLDRFSSLPAVIQTAAMYHIGAFLSQTEEDPARGHKILYCLSHHLAWKVLGPHQIVREFVEKIGGSEVVKEEFNPEPDWLPRRDDGSAYGRMVFPQPSHIGVEGVYMDPHSGDSASRRRAISFPKPALTRTADKMDVEI